MDSSRLDADELVQLAIAASRQDCHAEAIEYLKRALELAPNSATAAYMLGAEHAQIGLYDRAIDEITRAVELDPNLHAARFQLGLLYLTQARADEAGKAWRALDALGEGDPLYQFKTGLEHLARDEFDRCREHLERGLALNESNPALNTDMQRVLDEVATRQQGGAAKREDSRPAHVFLSAYKRTEH